MKHQRLLEYLANQNSSLATRLADELRESIKAEKRAVELDEKKLAREMSGVPELLDAIVAGWLITNHSVAITDDIESLRRIAVAHHEWWGFIIVPLLIKHKVPFDSFEAQRYSAEVIAKAKAAYYESIKQSDSDDEPTPSQNE